MAPEVPAIRGSRDETQAEILIRQGGVETGPCNLASFHNLSNRDEPLLCTLKLYHQYLYISVFHITSIRREKGRIDGIYYDNYIAMCY